MNKLTQALILLFLSFGAHAAAEPMVFAEHYNGAMRIDRNSAWISAEGEITADTPAAFEKFLANVSLWKDQRLTISSPGGSVLGGLSLERLSENINSIQLSQDH